MVATELGRKLGGGCGCMAFFRILHLKYVPSFPDPQAGLRDIQSGLGTVETSRLVARPSVLSKVAAVRQGQAASADGRASGGYSRYRRRESARRRPRALTLKMVYRRGS